MASSLAANAHRRANAMREPRWRRWLRDRLPESPLAGFGWRLNWWPLVAVASVLLPWVAIILGVAWLTKYLAG